MKRWLRHHGYALRVALRRLRMHPLSSLANIVVIALMLAVPILGASVLQSSRPLARQLSVAPQLTLFLGQNVNDKDQQAMADRIRDQYADTVGSVTLLPREAALKTLRTEPAWAQALAALPDNPLPDAMVVTLHDIESPVRRATALADELRQWPGVDHVQLDSDWVRRLDSLLAFVRLGLGLLAAAVAVVVLATVFNTVRLQALTQREEIAVARLVGATESFVRRPFLYLGALTGLAASLLALALARLALVPLNTILGRFAQTYGIDWSISLPGASDLALAGLVVVILGAVAARLSVTRRTRF